MASAAHISSSANSVPPAADLSPRLGRRERLVESSLSLAVATIAITMAIVLEWNRSFSWISALSVVGCYALASRVQFPVGGGWTDPTQVVFVAMFFAAPAPIVPLLVVCAFLVGRLPSILYRRAHLEHAVLVFGDSFYAFGPAAVFSIFQIAGPARSDWLIYVGAFAVQIVLDAVSYGIREWAAGGPRPKFGSLLGSGWAYGVDLLLSIVGFLVAVGMTASGPEALLLVLPLFVLFWLFAQDRRARIEGALELSHAYRGTAMLLGDVVEADHAYTGVHSQNVVELSVAVAEHLGLSDEQRRSVEFAALLHDVGKIAVPKEIIDKSGPLDDDEWMVMKRHTIDGQRMLERVGGVLARVGGLVRASHEHYDGSGYPDGLRGRQIPIEARIVTCCDAYSAMTTDRAYRSAMTVGEAVCELCECAGTHFDPVVVRALIETLERSGEYRPTGGGPAASEEIELGTLLP